MTVRDRAKTWVINQAHVDTDVHGQRQLVVGVTTDEWIQISGDGARPGDATTFVWVVKPNVHVHDTEGAN